MVVKFYGGPYDGMEMPDHLIPESEYDLFVIPNGQRLTIYEQNDDAMRFVKSGTLEDLHAYQRSLDRQQTLERWLWCGLILGFAAGLILLARL